jgi:hypothetical protein
VINRLREFLRLVLVNLARFINKCGNSRTIKNMDLRATFDVFWRMRRIRKLLPQVKAPGYGYRVVAFL